METGVVIDKDDYMTEIPQLPDYLNEKNQPSLNKLLAQLRDEIKDETQLKKDIENVFQLGEEPLNDEQDQIQKFFDYCVTRCIKEGNLEIMLKVVDLLPDLITKNLVANLIMQLTYVKVPSKWCKKVTFLSNHENLWGYRFPNYKSSPSLFDRFEVIPQHSATLCYVPLPGLCIYPEQANVLYPRKLSPFAKLIISNPSEVFQASEASSKIYESPPFQAIVKFKWHAFARQRFFIIFFIYIVYFALFTAATSQPYAINKGLLIASMLLGVLPILCWIQYAIINIIAGNSIRFFTVPTTYLNLLVFTLPIVTGIMFLMNVNNHTLTVFKFLSILFLWCGFMINLLAFKNTGMFIVVLAHICRRMVWLLLFLAIFLFASAHLAKVLLSETPNSGSDDFEEFSKSFKNIWSALLGDYSSLIPWSNQLWVELSKIAFSFLSNIIFLNILIALVNNVYEEVHNRSQAEWTLIRAQMIVFIELLFMMPSRQNRDYFPWTITYEAFTEEVDTWPKKLKENNIPIPWEDDSTDQIEGKMDKIKEMNKKIADELEELRQKLVKSEVRKEIFD